MVQPGVVALNEIEQTELAQHEAVIERGIGTFVEVGQALLAIRDAKLYRAEYGTFEDYCRERWGFTFQRAYQLMSAAQVVLNIKETSTRVEEQPLGEKHVRPLTKLSPEDQRDAWQRAVDTAPDGKITAGHVQRVVDDMTRPTPQRVSYDGTPDDRIETFEPLRAGPKVRLDVHFSSDTPEHYTPPEIIMAAIDCMGDIDLDPCSNSKSNPHIPAVNHYTQEDDGLSQDWSGRVYMNPPYGREIGQWVEKLNEEHCSGNVQEAIALVPARTDTQWWQVLRDYPVCFVTGRLKFVNNNESAPFPSAVFYLGNNIERFYHAFVDLGDIWQRIEPGMFGE